MITNEEFQLTVAAQFNPKRTNKAELGAKMGHYGSQGYEKTDFLDENLCSYTHQY